MSNKSIPYHFEGWFTILLPDTWELNQEDEILEIYSTVKPKGVIQVSFYRREDQGNSEEIAVGMLDNFIQQFSLCINEDEYMILESDHCIIALTTGEADGRFLKVWFIVEESRILLVTYNSTKRTRELTTVDDIVYSIQFDSP